MRKLIKWIVLAGIMLALGIVVCAYYKDIMIQNVFDEIYYSELKNQHYKVTETRFENVKQLKMPIRDVWLDLHKEFTSYYYKEEHLNRNEFIDITIRHDEPTINVAYTIYGNKSEDNRDCISFEFIYNDILPL